MDSEKTVALNDIDITILDKEGLMQHLIRLNERISYLKLIDQNDNSGEEYTFNQDFPNKRQLSEDEIIEKSRLKSRTIDCMEKANDLLCLEKTKEGVYKIGDIYITDKEAIKGFNGLLSYGLISMAVKDKLPKN